MCDAAWLFFWLALVQPPLLFALALWMRRAALKRGYWEGVLDEKTHRVKYE